MLGNSASWVENSLEETISRFRVKALKVNELVRAAERKKGKKEGRFRREPLEAIRVTMSSPHSCSRVCAHIFLASIPLVTQNLADAGAREPDFLHVCCAKYAEIFKFVSLVH